jgi:hypothetical protein
VTSGAPSPDEEAEVQALLDALRDGTREQTIAARDGLGRVFERRGLLDEAAECYETNIRAGVRDRGLYYRLAAVYRRQGRSDLADEVDEEARRLPIPGGSAARPAPPAGPPVTPGRSSDTSPLEAPTQPMEAAADRPGPRRDRSLDETIDDASPAYAFPGDAIGRRPATATPRTAARAAVIAGALLGLLVLLLAAFWALSGSDSLVGLLGGSTGQPTAPPAQPGLASTPVLPAASPAAGASPSPAAAKPEAGASPSPGAASPVPAAKPAASPAAAAQRVRVANTGGEGASLREQPSTSAARVKGLTDGTLLEVIGADQQAEGRTWRNVRDPEGATGWVAAEFVEPA